MEDLVRWLSTQLDTDAEKARTACEYASPDWHLDEEFGETVLWWPPEPHIAEKEREKGLPVVSDRWRGETVGRRIAPHIAEWDPARVLREIDSKRRTLIRCEEEMLSGIPRLVHFAKQTVREMAAVYEQRPGYEAAVRSFLDRPAPREEQRPERARQAPPAKVTDPDELPMAPGCEHWRREHRADLCPMAVCKRCRFLERL